MGYAILDGPDFQQGGNMISDAALIFLGFLALASVGGLYWAHWVANNKD